MAAPRRSFDRDYYRRFYSDRHTRVTDRAEMSRRAALIGAILKHFELRVRTILDVGCGVGLLRAPLLAQFADARYQGLETSDYLCRRFGWIRGSIVDYSTASPADLTICYDVAQYLDDRSAARAMARLAAATRMVLYFSALTTEDWRDNCDQARTDGNVHLRTGRWYRARLARRFRPIGLGLWLKRGYRLVQWELEKT